MKGKFTPTITSREQNGVETTNMNNIGQTNEGLDVSGETLNGVHVVVQTPDGISPKSATIQMKSRHVSGTSSLGYTDVDDEDSENVSLLYSRHEKIPMKDFSAEVRAPMDVENFLNQAQLILDMDESNMEGIVDRLLEQLVKNEERASDVVEEVKRAIFTHDSVHQLSKTIQGTCYSYAGGYDYDQSWISVLCSVPSIQKRHVVIARLKHAANMGRTSQEVHFIALIVTPAKEKRTKDAMETGRTFSTLFCDIDLRLRLLSARTDEEFKHLLLEHSKALADEHLKLTKKKESEKVAELETEIVVKKSPKCQFGHGLKTDLLGRLKFYASDFKDGFMEPEGIHGHRTIQKTASTTIFLYFACILPSIALGVLNDVNTGGALDVKTVIYSQTIGGLFFALVGGQPMVILLTTAPLALYTKVVYTISKDFGLNFMAMYACTGLWNSFFLIVYSVVGASRLMKWSSRSTEEIFSLFISIAFTVDAIKHLVHDFQIHYVCDNPTALNQTNASQVLTGLENITSGLHDGDCARDHSILYLLLCLGTVWLGLSIFNFTKTPFLNAGKRELLADYALPVSVLVMSFFGSYVFRAIELVPFQFDDVRQFAGAPLNELPWTAVLGSMGMGFSLSLLFFMDQNISEAMVNSPDNKMKKGTAYHWDLLVVAVLNAVLTYFGLPMVHGALPHSPLHVRAMADVEDRVDQGHVYQTIVHVRETRVTGILAHILIGLSLFLLPYPLSYIPKPVLDGLFLYLAVSALNNNQMFERVLLLVTEQAAYPPNHYIRSVPQRKVHIFTFTQICQLGALCAFGFAPVPYVKMVFPILLLILMPIRHKLIPCFIEEKYLDALDHCHGM